MKTQETLNIEQVLTANRDKILEIATKHGACNVRIFGSVIRGEAGAGSDIDFLVDLGEKLSPWFPAGLIHDLENLLNRKVDVVTEKSLHYSMREQVLQEAKLL
jgi:predicted nucleotidyltransferase